MKKIQFKAVHEGNEYIVDTLGLKCGKINPLMSFAHSFNNSELLEEGTCVSFNYTTKFYQVTENWERVE